MRFLHCVGGLSPECGGPTEFLRQMSELQRDAGNVFEVLTLDSPDDPWIKRFPATVHALGPTALHYGFTPRLIPWLRSNRHRFDLVVFNGIWQYTSFGGWLSLRGTDTPYVVFLHGMLDPWFNRRYPLKRLKKYLYWPWAEYRVLRDARAVLFTSEEERLRARNSFIPYRAREIVVPYGIRGPGGDPLAQREAFLSRYPELRGKRVLLFLGRIHEMKGCDLVLRAFARLAERHQELHLVLAGPCAGNYGARLRRDYERDQPGVSRRVTWTDMLAGDLKWGAFRTAEAFILPSHRENFGISVAEALACGVPVLISNQVNIWREIQSDRAGLVEPDTVDGTSRLLERWLAVSEEEKQEMRLLAGQCFLRRFDMRGNFPRLLEILQQCAAPAAAAPRSAASPGPGSKESQIDAG